MTRILKAMRISGIISLLCLIMSIFSQGYIYTNYSRVLKDTNSAIEAIRQIVLYSTQYQLTVYKNTYDKQDYVDYRESYDGYSSQIDRMLSSLEENSTLTDIDPDKSMRHGLKADVNMLIVEGAKKTPPEVDLYTKSIASKASLMTAYLDINKQYRMKELVKYEAISYMLDVVLVLICLSTIYISWKYARKSEREYEEEVERENFTDGLTGLLNQKYATTVLPKAVSAEGRGYVYMLDMDNFKTLNDTKGHAAGDEALKVFSQVLLSNIREGDMACRLGGDEFLLYVRDIDNDKEARALAARLQKSLKAKVERSPLRIISISCGIAPVRSGVDFDRVKMSADKALYYVKENRKGTYHLAKRKGNRTSKQKQ